MPGFTMHLAEASQLLPELKKRYPVDEAWQNRFLLGTLLPDTKTMADKKTSHFWVEEDMDKLARAPHLELFCEKYRGRLSEPCLLGYWAHLYLDYCYVSRFWPTMLSFLDENGRETPYTSQITNVKILRSGELVPLKNFYTVDYYYGDYNRMNQYFFDRYPIQIPYYEEGFDPGIEEVKIHHMHRVLEEMDLLVASLQHPVPGEVKAFDVEAFDRFITENAVDFLKLSGHSTCHFK